MKKPSTRKTPPKHRVVDLREAAEILKVDPLTLFKMLTRGEFPTAFRFGGVWRVELDELKRVLKTNVKGAK